MLKTFTVVFPFIYKYSLRNFFLQTCLLNWPFRLQSTQAEYLALLWALDKLNYFLMIIWKQSQNLQVMLYNVFFFWKKYYKLVISKLCWQLPGLLYRLDLVFHRLLKLKENAVKLWQHTHLTISPQVPCVSNSTINGCIPLGWSRSMVQDH